MKIIDGVRYSDEDVKALGLSGGREAPVGDREIVRTTVAVGQADPEDGAKSKPKPLSTTEKEKVQSAGQDGGDADQDGGDSKPARRAR